MKTLTKETYQIVKLNSKNLLLFELLYRLITGPIFIQAVDYGLKFSLRMTGYSYLTLSNIGKVLLNPWTILAVGAVSFLGLIFLLIEIGGLLTAFSGAAYFQKMSPLDILLGGFTKLGDEVRRKNVRLLGIALIDYVLTNLYLLYRVLTHVKPLNFVMMAVISEPLPRFILCVVLILFVLLAVPTIFVFHGCMIEQKSFRDSVSRSIRLLKGDWIRFPLLLTGYNMIMIAVFALSYMVCVLITAVFTVLFVDKKLEFAFLLGASDRIELVLIFLISIAVCVVNFAAVSVQYYQYSSRLNHEERWDFFYSSERIKGKKHAAILTGIIGLVSFLCMFDVVRNGSYITNTIVTEIGITAHRGSSKTAPENTMAALEAAVEEMADWAEIDVQETADGVVVLCHDSNLKRVADINKTVSSMTYEEISAVDVGSWFSKEFAGQGVPTLEEVMEYSKGRIQLNIEIKNLGTGSGLPEKVLELIERYGMEEQCVVTATSLPYLKRIKGLNPDIKTGYIISAAYGNYYQDEDVDFISLRSSFVTERLVERAHEAGKTIHAWTVNSRGEMERVKALGVDNIITDYPVVAREIIYGEEAAENLLEYLRVIFK